MVTIKIRVDGSDVHGYCDATRSSPLNERKITAIIMAAMDGITEALKQGGEQFALKSLIGPTITQRSKEGWLEVE